MQKSLWQLIHNSKDWVLLYLLCFLVFFTPLVFIVNPDFNYNYPKYFVSQLLISVFIILSNFSNKKHYLSKPIAIIFFLLLISIILSTIFSTHMLTSLVGYHSHNYIYSSLYTLNGLLFSFSIIKWLQGLSSEKIIKIIKTFILYASISIFIVCMFNFIEILENANEIFNGFRLRGAIGEPNRMAFFLLSVFPIHIYLLKQKSLLYKVLGLGNLLISLFQIFLTYSRGAWLIFIFILILFALIQVKKVKNSISFKNIILIILTLFIFFVSPLGSKFYTHLSELPKNLKNNNGSISLRLEEISINFSVIKQFSPKEYLIGMGPLTSSYEMLKLQIPHPELSEDQINDRTYITRNHYLQLFSDYGFLGLFTHFALLVYILIQYFSNYSNIKNKKITQTFFWGWVSINLIGCIYFLSIMNQIYYWIYTSILIVLIDKKTKSNLRIKSNLLNTSSIFFALFYIYFLIIYFVSYFSSNYAANYNFSKKYVYWEDDLHRSTAEFLIGKYVRLNNQELIKKAIKSSEKAIKLNPLEVENYTIAFRSYFKAASLDKKYMPYLYKYGKIRLELDPTSSQAYDDLGQAYLLDNKLNQARDAFIIAYQMNPYSLQTLLHIGETYKQQQNFDMAEKYYKMAIKKDPNYDFARKELEKIEVLKNNQQ